MTPSHSRGRFFIAITLPQTLQQKKGILYMDITDLLQITYWLSAFASFYGAISIGFINITKKQSQPYTSCEKKQLKFNIVLLSIGVIINLSTIILQAISNKS